MYVVEERTGRIIEQLFCHFKLDFSGRLMYLSIMPNALSECTIPLVLKKIGKDRLSGCLTVTVDSCDRQLFFEEGVLCFARTDDPCLRLGAVLVSIGLISPIDLDLFEPLLKVQTSRKVGEVLTDLGLISTPILHQALINQTVRIVADLFPRKEGTWDFDATKTCDGNMDDLRLEMALLMQEGVRAISDFSFYKNAFSPVCPKPTETADAAVGELTSVQRKFISKVGRLYPSPNSEMPKLMGMKEDLYWRAILLFYLLGRIDFIDRSEEDIAFDMEETAIIKMSELEKQIGSAGPIPDLTLPDKTPMDRIVSESPASSMREIIPLEEEIKPGPAGAEAQPQDAESCYIMAEKEFAQRNFFRALSLVEAALKKGQGRSKYFQLLGRIQMQFPNLRRDAEDSFLKQAALEPWNADPYYYLGELYQLEGLNQRAEKQFQKALELNMEHTKAGIRMNQLNPALFRMTAVERKGKK